jgi:hypothetical protein
MRQPSGGGLGTHFVWEGLLVGKKFVWEILVRRRGLRVHSERGGQLIEDQAEAKTR